MTREELQKLVDDNHWYNGIACGIGLHRILAHDAEQRRRIEELEHQNAALRGALAELYAQVKGECPSLLNEDSGGDANLAMQIEQALKEHQP